MFRNAMIVLAAVLAATVVMVRAQAVSAAESEFAATTIDLGVVVSDVDKAVAFYTKAIGFKEVEGFSVPADFAGDTGLTDNQALDIRVLVLGDDETATKLKLMTVPGVRSEKGANDFIHSQRGYSYITIMISDTNAALERLKKAGVKPLAKGPVALPKPLPQGVYLTVVRDPDGNIVELVGPKATQDK